MPPKRSNSQETNDDTDDDTGLLPHLAGNPPQVHVLPPAQLHHHAPVRAQREEVDLNNEYDHYFNPNPPLNLPPRPVQAQAPQNNRRNKRAPVPNAAVANFPLPHRNANNALVYSNVWTFTWWSNDPNVPPLLPDAATQQYFDVAVDYLVFQQELAPRPSDTNRYQGRHWQGYIEVSRRISELQLRQLLGWRDAFFEPRKGTQAGAIWYCLKDDTCIEGTRNVIGTPHPPDAPGQITELRHAILDGADYEEILRDDRIGDLCIRHPKGIADAIKSASAKPKIETRTNYLLSGKSRSGKTTWAAKHAKELGLTLYKVPKNGTFDGYKGEKAILFDEMNNKYDIDLMLEWLEPNPSEHPPTWINQKFGGCWAKWTHCYITTNLPLDKIYPTTEPAVREAFFARFEPKNIMIFTETWKEKCAREEQERTAQLHSIVNPPIDNRTGEPLTFDRFFANLMKNGNATITAEELRNIKY